MNSIITSGVTPAIIPFSFEGTEVRVLDQDGEPWWVLADVCKVLEIANAPNAAARLDDGEKSTVAIRDSGNLNADRTIINESGLWSLVLTSRKAAAKRFKKWITSEVSPPIRKTGRYITCGQAISQQVLARDRCYPIPKAQFLYALQIGVHLQIPHPSCRALPCAHEIPLRLLPSQSGEQFAH